MHHWQRQLERRPGLQGACSRTLPCGTRPQSGLQRECAVQPCRPDPMGLFHARQGLRTAAVGQRPPCRRRLRSYPELERARLAGGMAPVYDSRRDEHHAERAAPLCICALSWHSLNTACDGHACCRAVRVTGLVMHWCLWCAKQPSYRSENPVRPPLAWLLVSSRAGFTLLAPCCSSAPACLAACNCA